MGMLCGLAVCILSRGEGSVEARKLDDVSPFVLVGLHDQR